MNGLIAVVFKDEFQSSQVLINLRKLNHDELSDLEDATIAIRERDGTIKILQIQASNQHNPIERNFWGLLLGALFFYPILAMFSALAGSLSPDGIDALFIAETNEMLQPGTSAIFVLLRKSNLDRLLAALGQLDCKIVQTASLKISISPLNQAI
jgi:uncharacterized membrane protein